MTKTPIKYYPPVSGGVKVVLTFDYPTVVDVLEIVICVVPGSG